MRGAFREDLITPHGDWKPPFPHVDQTGESLITPHGDWKPVQPGRRPVGACPHYPSWGLETCHTQQRRRVVRLPHYPSWGLETRAAGFEQCATLRSLPLMGIGNMSCVVAIPSENGLITPHGDWKPISARAGVVSSLISLPLMGIGNATAIGQPDVVIYSHYPSWGLETSEARELGAETDGSLPLMGIGNMSLMP